MTNTQTIKDIVLAIEGFMGVDDTQLLYMALSASLGIVCFLFGILSAHFYRDLSKN